jgi:hypothetical protein
MTTSPSPGSRALWTARRAARWFAPRDVRRNVTVQRSISTRSVRGEPRLTRRAINVIRSISGATPRTGPIWAIAMVKDEGDIIEEVVRHLFDEGVDHVLIADNGSTDATPLILRRLAGEFPLDVVQDPLREFWDAEKRTLLARAATRMGAAWIVPFDGDELWFGVDGLSLAETLHGATAPVVEARWFNYVPVQSTTSGSVAQRFGFRIEAPDPLSKVAFRANWLARLTSGNHSVAVPDGTKSPGIRIAHYRFRSIEQMRQKATSGADAVQRSALPTKVDYWFEIAAGGEDAAQTMVDRLNARPDLVYDPASEWRNH